MTANDCDTEAPAPRMVMVPAEALEKVLDVTTQGGWCDACAYPTKRHTDDCPVPVLQAALTALLTPPAAAGEGEGS